MYQSLAYKSLSRTMHATESLSGRSVPQPRIRAPVMSHRNQMMLGTTSHIFKLTFSALTPLPLLEDRVS